MIPLLRSLMTIGLLSLPATTAGQNTYDQKTLGRIREKAPIPEWTLKDWEMRTEAKSVNDPQWNGHPRVGVDPKEIERGLADPAPEVGSQYTWDEWIAKMGRYSERTGHLGLPTQWIASDENRPREASVEEEVAKAIGNNWRQARNDTCASYAASALVKHRELKRVGVSPNWDPDKLTGGRETMGGAFRSIKNTRGIDFTRVEFVYVTDGQGRPNRKNELRHAWAPLMEEMAKQEIAKGYPVGIVIFAPRSESARARLGWDYTTDLDTSQTGWILHGVVLVGYKETIREDGSVETTWRAYDPAGPRESRGMINIEGDYLYKQIQTADSIR